MSTNMPLLKKNITYFIATVWLVNGLFCKILNLVPRHQEIVGRILGEDFAPFLTKTIGFSELLVVAWIVSGVKSKWCTIFQIIIVLTMNIIEFIIVPDILLFGRFNLIIAFSFVCLIYYKEFRLNNKD